MTDTDATPDEHIEPEPEPDLLGLLGDSWRQASAAGDRFPRLFYARVFDLGGQAAADLFPVGMAAQRAKLMATLGVLVRSVHKVTRAGELEAADVTAELRRLGADHRRFGAVPDHYPVVGQALLDALRYVTEGWTADHQAGWSTVLEWATSHMRQGAYLAEQAGVPAWVDCEVLEVDATDLSRVLVTVDVPSSSPFNPGTAEGVAEPINVARADRPGGWVEAQLVAGSHDRMTATIAVEVDDADIDTVALATVAPRIINEMGHRPGDRLRLAPVHRITTDPS
jgi:hemoglobin-like flavoprotein